MGTQLYQSADFDLQYRQIHSTGLRKYMLRRFHPRKMIFDAVGLMWSIYFLWNNDWSLAMLSLLGGSLLGLYFVRNVDPELMGKTTLGRIGLLHLNPVNLSIQIAGLIPFVYGIWNHAIEYILSGITVVLLGHFFGWSQVDENFDVRE